MDLPVPRAALRAALLQDGPGPMATRLNWKSARPLLLLYCDLRQRQLPFEPIPQNVAQVLETR